MAISCLTRTSPAQGDIRFIGETLPIRWETRGMPGNVAISISRRGGKAGTFETIASETPNDGAHDWTVAGSVSFNCVLKITPASDPSRGTVQGLFSIADRHAPEAVTGRATEIGDDTVRVLHGTYTGNFSYASYEADALVIEGGYEAGCSNRVLDPGNTVIDGGKNDTGLLPAANAATQHENVTGTGVGLQPARCIFSQGRPVVARFQIFVRLPNCRKQDI